MTVNRRFDPIPHSGIAARESVSDAIVSVIDAVVAGRHPVRDRMILRALYWGGGSASPATVARSCHLTRQGVQRINAGFLAALRRTPARGRRPALRTLRDAFLGSHGLRVDVFEAAHPELMGGMRLRAVMPILAALWKECRGWGVVTLRPGHGAPVEMLLPKGARDGAVIERLLRGARDEQSYAGASNLDALRHSHGQGAGASDWSRAARVLEGIGWLRRFHPSSHAFVLGGEAAGDVPTLERYALQILALARRPVPFQILQEGVARRVNWFPKPRRRGMPDASVLHVAWSLSPRISEHYGVFALAGRTPADAGVHAFAGIVLARIESLGGIAAVGELRDLRDVDGRPAALGNIRTVVGREPWLVGVARGVFAIRGRDVSVSAIDRAMSYAAVARRKASRRAHAALKQSRR